MGEEPVEVTPPPEGQRGTERPPDDPAQIRVDIAQTRAEMAETIDAIQERLSPERIVQQAKDTVREATVGKVKNIMSSATETAGDLADHAQDRAADAVQYVRDNPVPAALVGAGVAWLLMRGRGRDVPPVAPGTRSGTTSRPRQIATRRPSSAHWTTTLRENPLPAALAGLGVGWILLNRGADTAQVAPRTSAPPSATSQVRRTVDQAAEAVQDNWQAYSGRAEMEFDRWMRENPWTVGAVAVALGAAIGLAAPRTEAEDTWLGEARDTLVERAQDVAEGAVGRHAQQIVQGTEQMVGGTGATGI